MRFSTRSYLNRCVEFYLNQAIISRNPQEVCNYFPINVHVDIYDGCNLKCIHCHDHALNAVAPSFMDWDTFKKTAEQIAEIESAMTIGQKGEPLLHRDAEGMIRYAKDVVPFVSIITNGTCLTRNVIDAIVDVRVDRIILSIDSSRKEVYEACRRGAVYEKTFYNLMQLLKANYEAGSHVDINISCVGHSLVTGCLDETRSYFDKLPISNLFVSVLHSQQGLTQIEDETIFVKDRKAGLPPEQIPVCMNAFDRLYVFPQGNVNVCDTEIFQPDCIGNVHTDRLKNMWNNGKARRFRRAVISKNYESVEKNGPRCSTCDMKWIKNAEGYFTYIQELLANEIAMNTEFYDEGEKHTKQQYETVLEELKKLKQMIDEMHYVQDTD